MFDECRLYPKHPKAMDQSSRIITVEASPEKPRLLPKEI
jgi:hypothetical protein